MGKKHVGSFAWRLAAEEFGCFKLNERILMKVVILAGGLGTRLAEYTQTIPKPMVPIGTRPILLHIMERYAAYGHCEFIIAAGYKSDVIKKYFLDYAAIASDFTVNLATGECSWHNRPEANWSVTIVDTGLKAMTGGRVKRLKEFIADEPFMLTYGDGVADVKIDELEAFHIKQGKMVTVTTVRPSARFGELELDGDLVKSFKEKPQTESGWINGGFFVCEPDFLSTIDGDSTVLEGQPLEWVALNGQMAAYRHEGFWQCMDSVRDKDYLDSLWSENVAPWTKFDD